MTGSRLATILFAMDGTALSPAQRKYRSRKRTWVVFLVLVIFLFILQMAAAAGLMGLLVYQGFEEFRGIPLTDEDRAVLIRIGDLVGESDETDEHLRKWLGHRGSVHLLGRGFAERDRGEVRVYCEVLAACDPEWATQHYYQLEMSREPYLYIDRVGELVPSARSDLFTWGEDCTLYTLARDDSPAGIFFLARREGTVFLLAVSGRKLDDPMLLEVLLRPVLRKLERYER